jgi:hypothetical protein
MDDVSKRIRCYYFWFRIAYEGVLAHYAVESFGLAAPFILAGILMVFAFIMIISLWEENYGSDSSEPKVKKSNKPNMTLLATIKLLFCNYKILAAGVLQSCFESSMYTFVFLWSPVMEKVSGQDDVPFGIIFSTFMVYIMLGSLVFKYLKNLNFSIESILLLSFVCASISLLVPILTKVRYTYAGETFSVFIVQFIRVMLWFIFSGNGNF